MKTISALKCNGKVESPKTPGGISKSLLTPCRRVGLSRNWKKAGASPFVSPLSSNVEVKQESTTPKKRKRTEDPLDTLKQNKELSTVKESNDQDGSNDNEKSSNINTTPFRNVSLPQRKKTKTLATSDIDESVTKSPTTPSITINQTEVVNNSICEQNVVTTPISRTKSKSRSKRLVVESEVTKKASILKENDPNSEQKVHKNKSPENLTKECIVIIQKKIFKSDEQNLKDTNARKKELKPVSQALFDSDSDDVPLSVLNKNDVESLAQPTIVNLDNDDDFAVNNKIKVKNLEDKTTSTGGLPSKAKDKKRVNKTKDAERKAKTSTVLMESKPPSQSSFDDDEDFVTDKRTILIRKSYDKVTKPIKSKSTGSITQRDIDELKARIEMKKKLLLAKAMTKDTEELRSLIKKWQKGCQDALMELMELMKQKFPDKQNMDYSEILQALKIPATIVGYDEENDSFITPTDENIILSKFNDL